MKPLDLVRTLRRDAALDPAALDRGKAELMAAIRQEAERERHEERGRRPETDPRRRAMVVPQVPYEDIGAALAFLERAFGFRELVATRLVSASGRILHANVEVGEAVIGIGTQGAHGAVSPKSSGIASQYIRVSVPDVDAHYGRAVAAGARIAAGLHDEPPVRAYEALDVEGHRWRFVQWV